MLVREHNNIPAAINKLMEGAYAASFSENGSSLGFHYDIHAYFIYATVLMSQFHEKSTYAVFKQFSLVGGRVQRVILYEMEVLPSDGSA